MEGTARFTVELNAETVGLLGVLGKGWVLGGKGGVQEVIERLIHSAADGVRRPGAWERSWLQQAFSDDWEALLEVDPVASFRRRPRPQPEQD